MPLHSPTHARRPGVPSFTFNTCGARSCKLTCIQATHVRGTASTILTTPCTGSCGGHARICTIRTILSIASAALGGADARPQTLLLALSPDAVMLVYLRSATFLAPALDALVEANARPQTLTHSYLMLSAAFLARVLLAFGGGRCSTPFWKSHPVMSSLHFHVFHVFTEVR